MRCSGHPSFPSFPGQEGKFCAADCNSLVNAYFVRIVAELCLCVIFLCRRFSMNKKQNRKKYPGHLFFHFSVTSNDLFFLSPLNE